MTATVLSFPDRFRKAEDRPPAASEPNVELPVPPGRQLPRDARVMVPMPVFEAMVDALKFYAHSGFDHGVIARRAMTVPGPQLAPGDAA
ncbi:hypothetical protein [Paraburkholderia sp.]|uniref:hypothetical protein n=1 Tax=Paraburkholderia sp. TaxID=1926495 RepID=UPI0039E545C4